jgi:hypothetical protein
MGAAADEDEAAAPAAADGKGARDEVGCCERPPCAEEAEPAPSCVDWKKLRMPPPRTLQQNGGKGKGRGIRWRRERW